MTWQFWLLIGILAATLFGFLSWRMLDIRQDLLAWRELSTKAANSSAVFNPSRLAGLPEPAQRYFRYTITPGAVLYTVVELEMVGELGLGNRETPKYSRMKAKQILAPPYGLVWRLTSGLMSGSDALTPTMSWTRFWLLHLIPVIRVGANTDHHRSAFGRVASEGAFWAPASLLPSTYVRWEELDHSTARAIITYGELEQVVDITVADDGQPVKVMIQRWSNANESSTYRFVLPPYN